VIPFLPGGELRSRRKREGVLSSVDVRRGWEGEDLCAADLEGGVMVWGGLGCSKVTDAYITNGWGRTEPLWLDRERLTGNRRPGREGNP